MSIKDEQSLKYMEEAELTLYSAQAIFDRAIKDDKDLWAQVIKSCYDAIEHAVSSAIASKSQRIPIKHPEKIDVFSRLFDISESLEKRIVYWFGKRSSAQYVDIKDNRLSVPHELFCEDDAKRALTETKEVISEIRRLIDKRK